MWCTVSNRPGRHPRVVERRPGDVPCLEAAQAAQTVLGWSACRSLEEMRRDGWAWQQANPSGYRHNP